MALGFFLPNKEDDLFCSLGGPLSVGPGPAAEPRILVRMPCCSPTGEKGLRTGGDNDLTAPLPAGWLVGAGAEFRMLRLMLKPPSADFLVRRAFLKELSESLSFARGGGGGL